MIKRSENEELLFLVVPIAADTAEYSRAVIEPVRQYPHLCFRIWYNLVTEKRVSWKRHDEFLDNVMEHGAGVPDERVSGVVGAIIYTKSTS